jgi:coproporphyrinogen III oxidase-like Fe-S oxidoreductase
MEANPTSVEAGRLADYRAAGVNRLSIGVQALDDADLRALGRKHTVDEALDAVAKAARVFDRYSFDLIYARPEQSETAWRAELKRAIAHAAEHLSLYQLTIEPGTMFEQRVRAGQLIPLDADRARGLFDVTQEVCADAGLPAYEISNHARPGAESRHNLVYWRYGEYAGIGPGAHGRLLIDGVRHVLVSERHPEHWLEQVERDGHGLIEQEQLIPSQEADELLLMGLRLREGISLTRHARLAGHYLDAQSIDDLVSDGVLERLGNDRIRATIDGVPVLDAVIAALSR